MINPEIVAIFKQIKFELPSTKRTVEDIRGVGGIPVVESGGPLIKSVKTVTPDEKAFVLDPSIVNQQTGCCLIF